jgi:hypothetical protein
VPRGPKEEGGEGSGRSAHFVTALLELEVLCTLVASCGHRGMSDVCASGRQQGVVWCLSAGSTFLLKIGSSPLMSLVVFFILLFNNSE